MLKDFITDLAEIWLEKQNIINEEDYLKDVQEHTKNENANYFNNIMLFVDDIIDKCESQQNLHIEHSKECIGNHPLVDVIRLLGRDLQTKYMLHLVKNYGANRMKDITFDNTFFNSFEILNEKGETYHDLKNKVSFKKEVYLNKDVILPWSWSINRLKKSIVDIGDSRNMGIWKQDDENHHTYLLLPIGVTFVDGGNHSITTGIIQGEGVITPECIYDISKVYDYVKCDGENYYLKKDGTIISSVKNVEFAAIFEIGRKMIQLGVSF